MLLVLTNRPQACVARVSVRKQRKRPSLCTDRPPPISSPQNRAGGVCTQTKKDRGTGFSVLVPQKKERAPFLARFSHRNAFKLLRHGEPQISSPPISISHRLFRCRYSNSKDVVASSPFFSCPAAIAPRGACLLANKLSHPSRFRAFDRAPFIFIWRVIFSFFGFSFLISFSFFFSAFCSCKLRNYA